MSSSTTSAYKAADDVGARPPLTVGQLVAYTQLLTREIRAGAHVAEFDPQQRWHRRLYRDARVDVWLISWLPEQGTQLHDHGGSAGAFTVIEGELTETVLTRTRDLELALTDRRRAQGSTVGFDARHVHDVSNLGTQSAVSVHAYSPPLTSMNFYDLDDGQLVPFASLDTDDPESAAPTPPPETWDAEITDQSIDRSAVVGSVA